MSLKLKFFTVILLVNGLLAGGLYLFLSWNFERSFSNYLNQRELRILDSFAVQLENFYKEQRNWSYFENNATHWNSFTFQTLLQDARQFRRDEKLSRPRGKEIRKPDIIERLKNRREENSGSNRHWNFRQFREIPIVLLDEDKRVVVGSFPKGINLKEKNIERTLKLDGNVIGYLSMPTRPSVRDYLDNQFIKDQSNNLIVILACVLILTILASITLSLFLIKRITLLVNHVKLLSGGEYDSKISINGNDELNVLSNHLADLGETLKENTHLRKRWVADISHELRTPVAILQADLEAIEDGVRDLDQKSVLRLQSHVGRLKNLINDLYELSLSDSGSLTYNKHNVSLTKIVNESFELTKEKCEAKYIDYQYHSLKDINDIMVYGDQQRLMQLLLNVLNNAVKYTDSTMESPGKIAVDFAIDEHADKSGKAKYAVITIQDSAPGVSPEILPRLTERLFRVDHSRSRDTGGAGLGLALCKSIVEAHQGQLDFSMSQFGGLSVKISLPVVSSS